MRKYRYIIIILFNFFIISPSFAFLGKKDIGTTSAQFLKLGVGGQANAMGEAVTALVNDSTSIYWNPSGLSSVKDKHLSLMHNFYIADIFYDYITYAQSIRKIGTFGLGIQYVNYGSMKETDSTGSEISDFTPYDLSVAIGYAREINESFRVGLSTKYVISKIKNTATAVAFDIGGQYYLFNDSLLLGLVAQNIGTRMKFISEGNSLPLNIKLGVGYKLIKNSVIELDVNLPSDNTIIVGIGAQYSILIKTDFLGNGAIIPRVGYNTRSADILGFKGFSSGIGFSLEKYGLDYAFVPFGDLGLTHRISVFMKF